MSGNQKIKVNGKTIQRVSLSNESATRVCEVLKKLKAETDADLLKATEIQNRRRSLRWKMTV